MSDPLGGNRPRIDLTKRQQAEPSTTPLTPPPVVPSAPGPVPPRSQPPRAASTQRTAGAPPVRRKGGLIVAGVAAALLVVGGGAFLLSNNSGSDSPNYASTEQTTGGESPEPVTQDTTTEEPAPQVEDTPAEVAPPVEETPTPELPVSVTVRDTNGVQLRLRNKAGLHDEANKQTIKGGADEGDVLYIVCLTDGFTYFPSNSSSSNSTWARTDSGKYAAAWYLVMDDGTRADSADSQTLPRC